MANTRHMEPEELVEGNEPEDEELEAAPEEDDANADDVAGDISEAPAPEPDTQLPAGIEGSLSFFSRIKWGRVALACLFVFLVVAAALFVWNRWYRFDDAADIQGTWRDVYSGAVMEVNATHMKLAENAVFEYHIDTTAKTISYNFGGSEGFSSYRFSEDRQRLVLEDGAETDWSLVFHFQDDPGFAEGELSEGMTRLEKVSNDIPEIKLPGGNRPAGALVQSEPQKPSASSSAASSGTAASSSAASSKPKASQTEPDENGHIVGPDRNAKGYYDEQGIFVPVSYGHFDASGEWVDDGAGGYMDEEGNWIEGPTGYYDANGLWVDYNAPAQESTGSESGQNANASGGTSGYYDQYGNWVDTSSWNTDGTPAKTPEAADGQDGGETEEAYDESW